MNRRTLLSTIALVATGGCTDCEPRGSSSAAEPTGAGREGGPAEANDALVVTEKALTEGRDGYPLVRGVARNVAARALVDARVRVSVEVGGATIPRELRRDRLAPGETWAWSVLFDDPVLGSGPEITEWQVVTFAEYAR